MEYVTHLVVLGAIYALLGVSLELVAGQVGLVSVAHAAFFAVGAYTSAILTLTFGFCFAAAALSGMVIAGVLSLAVGSVALRLRGDYFCVATFCLQLVVIETLKNWNSLTRGPLGLPGVPTPSLFGWLVQTRVDFAVLAVVLAATGFGIVRAVSRSGLGRVLRAVREDEELAMAWGKDCPRAKLTAVAVSACLASVAGSVFAHYLSFVDPSSFGMSESILILSTVVVGGAGDYRGALAGVLLLVVLPEAFRFVGVPSTAVGHVREAAVGALLLGAAAFWPKGLVGRYNWRP